VSSSRLAGLVTRSGWRFRRLVEPVETPGRCSHVRFGLPRVGGGLGRGPARDRSPDRRTSRPARRGSSAPKSPTPATSADAFARHGRLPSACQGEGRAIESRRALQPAAIDAICSTTPRLMTPWRRAVAPARDNSCSSPRGTMCTTQAKVDCPKALAWRTG
jgi:hypothetical protein